MGFGTLDILCINASLIVANYKFSDQADPFEASIRFTAPLKTKTYDFISREALIGRKDNLPYSWSASTSTQTSPSAMETASISTVPRPAS